MKSVTLKKPQPMDLFGLKLQPGSNDVEDADWDKVKDAKLGAMDMPYVQWARAEGVLVFEDESPAQADEPGPGASDEPAAPSAQAAAPGPEVAAPKKRGRPPKGT